MSEWKKKQMAIGTTTTFGHFSTMYWHKPLTFTHKSPYERQAKAILCFGRKIFFFFSFRFDIKKSYRLSKMKYTSTGSSKQASKVTRMKNECRKEKIKIRICENLPCLPHNITKMIKQSKHREREEKSILRKIWSHHFPIHTQWDIINNKYEYIR